MCNPNKKIKAIKVMTLIFLLLLYTVLSRKINLRQPLLLGIFFVKPKSPKNRNIQI